MFSYSSTLGFFYFNIYLCLDKDYESVIKVAGSPIQYWAICPTNTSTSFDIIKQGTLPDSPYDETTLGSLVWAYRGNAASSVSVVAKVVSEDGGDTPDTPDDPVLPDEEEPEKISAPAVGDKGIKINNVFR